MPSLLQAQFYTCKKKNKESVGNFINFRLTATRLDIIDVQTKYCQPKSNYKGCSCGKLLDGLLKLEQNSGQDLIGIYLDMQVYPSDYIAGCRCYLGAPARAGFNSLTITNAHVNRCNVKKQYFNIGHYGDLCDDMYSNLCDGQWKISKNSSE